MPHIATASYQPLPPTHDLVQNRSLTVQAPSDSDTSLWVKAASDHIQTLQEVIDGTDTKMGLAAKAALGDMSKLDMLRARQAEVGDLQNKISLVQNANRNAGFVFATSGYRTVSHGDKTDWAMDWSLIRLANHRTMENIIRIPNLSHAKGFFDNMPADEWSTVVLSAQVRKKGRSTGWTRGTVNSIKAIMGSVGAEYNKEVRVYSIVGDNESRFNLGGDSGSVVFDEEKTKENKTGTWVGLLNAGDGLNHGYMVPISLVFEDIKRVTGCDTVELI